MVWRSYISPLNFFYRATACNATHGIVMRKLFVRPSVERVDCDKTKETCNDKSYTT